MKILVLCHGNINRSPLVAGRLRSLGLPHDDVRSAGFVNPGKRAAKKMREAASELGVDLSQHRSSLVLRQDVEWADLVIYMDGGNRTRLQALLDLPVGGTEMIDKAHCLARYSPMQKVSRIADPAFMKDGSDEFRAVVSLMNDCTMNLAKMIASGDVAGQKATSGEEREPT